ncbi:MAG: PorP/SprF family type IX secretion system membrane protein [Bacteroidota bacterium]
MKYYKKNIVLSYKKTFCLLSNIFALSYILPLSAQQLPLFSSFDQNLYLINPGMTGFGRYTFFSTGAKKQWTGFEGSPFTQQFSVHSSINEKNIGVGGSFLNDTRGILRTTGFSASFGYHLKAGANAKLGMGITGNFYSYSLDQSAMNLYHPDDALLQANMKSGLVPNFAVGMALYREDYVVGISAVNLLSSKINFNETHQNTEATHYYLHAKWRIQNNEYFGFTPSLLASSVNGYTYYADLQTTFHFYNRFDFILGARNNKDIHMGAGMEIIENLRLYYYYDMILSSLRPGNGGSHEIFITYNWYYNPFYKGDKARYKWIRKGRIKNTDPVETETIKE